jgi:hypothetical protein
MATLLKNGTAPQNPCPLGYIKPTAGAPLQITSNYTDLVSIPNIVPPQFAKTAKAITIEADPAMTTGHYVYVLTQRTATAADTTNGLNVIAKLSAGQSYTVTAYAGNQIFLQDFWIDVSNTGDLAIASYEEF